METRNSFTSLREGGRTIRMNTNRREDMCLKRELDDVNTKTIADLKVKRELKQLQEPTVDEVYNSQMQNHFVPEPPKRERKSQPVFHDIKTKDVKPDQLYLLPDVPAYSPVDSGPKVILQSRTKKYPYVKKKIVTTEEMKKPHISSVGVVPVRDSLEIPNLCVILEGDKATAAATEPRPKLHNTPATSFFIPKLPLEDPLMETDSYREIDESQRNSRKPEETSRMPAILSTVGTSSTVTFCERTKPPTKTSYLKSRKVSAKIRKKDTIRTESAQSFQSSLISGEIDFTGDQDVDYESDVDTAIGAAEKSQKREPSREGSVKSVKELIEEARRISSSEGEPIYKQNADGDTGKKTPLDSKQKGGRKSSKSSRSLKSASSSGKEGMARDRKKSATKTDDTKEPRRGERTVDEIIASLKDQSAYNLETEADRKIKEIMNRVMSRTTAVLAPDFEGDESETLKETDESITGTSDYPDNLDLNHSLTITPDPPSQTQESPRTSGGVAQGSDSFREAMKDGNLVPELITEDEAEGLSLTTRTTDTYAAMAEIAEAEFEEDNKDHDGLEEFENDFGFVDVQQCWEDLLAPPVATAEDILSVHGEVKDIHECALNPKSTVPPSSLSLLSSWSASGEKRAADSRKKSAKPSQPSNIHHFCTMTTEFQLPDKFMHVGRNYHVPDKYPSIKSDQPYRFKPGEPIIYERDLSSADTNTRYDAAAERVISEANNHVFGSGASMNMQQQLQTMENMVLKGQPIAMGNVESQVYWNPAPPKLAASSAIVRDLLFSQYQVEQLDEFGQIRVKPRIDEESDSSEEEKEEEISKEDREAMQRTTFKRHNSAENLILFGSDNIEEEEPETQPDLVDDVTETEAPGDESGTNLEGDEATAEEEMKDDTTEDKTEKDKKSKKEPKKKRPRTAPYQIGENDDTLIVPQDFNTAMHEISEQRRLLEKAKKQMRVQEAFEELENMEEPEEEIIVPITETFESYVIPEPVKKVKDELTPAEKALLAGRNYVILPKKKKKKKGYRPVDMARIEAVEKFLRDKPAGKLERHESLPKLNKIIERELRVPWHVRTHRSSLPDLLNFQDYQKKKRKPKAEDTREWVRGIWNRWFDQVFPPTPDGSDVEEEDDVNQSGKDNLDNQNDEMNDHKSKKDVISDILSQDVEAIDPIIDSSENVEIYQILTEEIDKLCEQINFMHIPSAFDLCRRGALYRKIGLLKKAEQDLDRAINMEPDLLDAYWHRHLLYILQERKPAALDDLNYIMKKNKSHAGAYRSMAEIYKKQGDTTMAIINYSSAIKSNPVDHEAFYQRAQLYEERGEMLLAMEDYTKAMKILPTRTDAIMKHAMYYFENENWQNSINDFTELLKVDPLNASARLFRGRSYAKLNNWVPAVEDLSAAIHLDPYNWQAFYQRACILRRAHPKRALQDYSVSLMLNDSEENVMSYLHRGILYDTLGKPEDSIPDFESVLKLNKDIAAAHVNLGLIYMTKHLNYHRAIKKFSSAIKVDPTYVRAYVCRAEAYHKIHEVKNALKDFTRAIHLRPDMQHLYMYRGQLVLELGNLDLAGFCVRHASELGLNSSSNGFGGSPTQQAVVQSFLKNYDKAVDALVQASRVKPIAPYFMLLGKTYMKAKQFKEAVTSFKQALEKMCPWKKRDPWPPETADAHYLSGLCHMELRNYSDALQQFNFAIKFNPSYADAFYQRGLAAVKMKQMKGIQDFNRALALNPNIFQAYLSRACYYGLKGKYAKAILNCNEAIKLQPRSVRAFLYRGSLKYHIKAYELAILDLSKAAVIDTQCPLPYFNRAVCYHENHQYDKALTDYGIVLLLGSMLSLKVLINRGLLYFEQKDYMNALFDFQSAAKLSPKDHRIHHTLGLCFHKLNRLKEAVQTFTQCLQIKPFFLDGVIARGNVFMDYGNARGLEFSKRDYQRALHLDPMCLPARVNLAYTAQMSGKLMQAWKHFTAVIEVKPSYKPALEGRSVVNLQMSNVFAAFQDITGAIKYGATAELLTNRGVINQFMGDPVMAMQDYQRAIKVDANYALAYFNAANVYFHTRHFTQALDYYSKAISHKPDDESAFLNRAITKVLLHDTQGALDDFKVAAKLSPFSAHIYFNRGNLYASMQLFDKAEKEYSKALSLKPDDALMLKRRSHVRGKLGKQSEAIEDYKRAVNIQTRPNKVVNA